MNEPAIECSPAPREMAITRTAAGVRVLVPVTPGARIRMTGCAIILVVVIVAIWLWGVLDFAQVSGVSGVVFLSILCGLGVALAVVAAIVGLAMKRSAIIEVDANELRMWRAGTNKAPQAWPRQKVRGILIKPLPTGLSILIVQIGFDPPIPLRVPYDSEKLLQAAETLHEALGIAQPPRKGGMLPIQE